MKYRTLHFKTLRKLKKPPEPETLASGGLFYSLCKRTIFTASWALLTGLNPWLAPENFGPEMGVNTCRRA